MDKKIFVSRLKELKEKMNLKQRDMYEAMQCSQSAYSTYENPDNNKFPSAENLYNLSQRFHVSIDWLLGNEASTKNNKDITLADIIKCLFWIDDRVELYINQHENGIQMPASFYEVPDYFIDSYEICFPEYLNNDIELNDFLKEWKEIKEFCKGKSIGGNMYELWKNDILKKASKIPIVPLLPFTVDE